MKPGCLLADPDLKIEKMADPDLFLLDPERFRILKFVDPATSARYQYHCYCTLPILQSIDTWLDLAYYT